MAANPGSLGHPEAPLAAASSLRLLPEQLDVTVDVSALLHVELQVLLVKVCRRPCLVSSMRCSIVRRRLKFGTVRLIAFDSWLRRLLKSRILQKRSVILRRLRAHQAFAFACCQTPRCIYFSAP